MKHKRFTNKRLKQMLNEVLPEMEMAREEHRSIEEFRQGDEQHPHQDGLDLEQSRK